MLLGVCLVALLAAAGIFLRRVWSAWGFAMLLACAIVAMLFFAITGQGSGSFLQALISVGLYGGIACLFVLAGLSLKVEGAKMGWPAPWILVDRFSGAHAAMGNLVAFHNPKDWQQILIRRVAGVPGSVVNGSVIPAGKYYVLGDAPGKSVDSRNFGFVDAAAIVGKPKFVYDSLAPDPADLNAQSDLAMPTHPPTRRWERVFKAL